MNENLDIRANVFREFEDHESWQKYEDYLQVRPDVTEERREILLRMYKFFRKELGENYLGRHYKDGRNLVNNWLWSLGSDYSQLIWLYDSLKYFKDKNCNYDKVVGHLKKIERSNIEGVPFLIIGDSLRKVGFEVIFEPTVPYEKKPDLKIINLETNETIYIEVSKLGPTDQNEKIQNNYHTLMHFFHSVPPIIPFSGRQLQLIPEEEFENLRQTIISRKQKAFLERELVEVGSSDTNGYIEFAVAHSEKFSELEALEKERNFGGLNDVRGLPLRFDYTYRVKHKILDEAVQLPNDYAGIIYIPLEPMFVFFGITDHIEFFDSIKTCLKALPHVIGVCFYSGIGMDSEEFVFSDGDFFERKIVHDNILQEVAFIKNPQFALEVSDDTLLKLEKSFSNIFC